jgi:UTP-glucose-1-phosphate uridylyltransferase
MLSEDYIVFNVTSLNKEQAKIKTRQKIKSLISEIRKKEYKGISHLLSAVESIVDDDIELMIVGDAYIDDNLFYYESGQEFYSFPFSLKEFIKEIWEFSL